MSAPLASLPEHPLPERPLPGHHHNHCHIGTATVETSGSQPSGHEAIAPPVPRAHEEPESDGPPPKRSRIHEPSSPRGEVISLISDDEGPDSLPNKPTRPQGNIQSPGDQHGWFIDVHGSGSAIPSGLAPSGTDTGGVSAPGMSSFTFEGGTHEDKSSNDVKTEHVRGPTTITAGIFPASTGPPPEPMTQSQETPRHHVPVKEPPLCPEQAELVDIIMSGRNVFYTGSAGCGKSTVLKAFTRRLRDRGLRVDIVAPTGISALGVGGSTTFVYAGWNLDSFKQTMENLRRGAHARQVRKRLKDTDVLVIDEISMVENFHFERLSAVLQEARGSYEPFGGVQIVVTGDFHQLPPVKPFAHCLQCGDELEVDRSEECYACEKHGIYHDEDKWAFKSKTWARCNFVYFHLRTIYRQNDETFIKILQKCRIGEPLTGEDTDILMNHPCKTGNATKLYARRDEVRRENRIRFDKLVSEKYTFPCMDDFHRNPDHQHFEKHNRRLPDGSLDSLKDHRYESLTEFKKGMLVVLLTNLDLGRKLCNGSQGIVCGYEDYDVRKLPRVPTKSEPDPEDGIHGDYAEMREKNIKVFIERPDVAKKVWPIVRFHNGQVRTIFADCSVHTLGKQPYSLLCRTQIPLAPAWAMSIHKSQSLTLDRVIVDLTRAWEEGQVYVALSRATSLDGLKIEGDPRGLAVGKGGNSEVRRFHMERFGI